MTRAADQGEAVEPLTTIGWLLWHIGSLPGCLAQLDFLGGSRTSREGWTSCYLTAHPVFTRAADAVDCMRAGWRALEVPSRPSVTTISSGPPGVTTTVMSLGRLPSLMSRGRSGPRPSRFRRDLPVFRDGVALSPGQHYDAGRYPSAA